MADTELTDDEFTVLSIAAQGESLMPIGRWKGSVESLVKKGLLSSYDKFNNVISITGRAALEARDKKVVDEYAEKVVEVHNAQVLAKNEMLGALDQVVTAVKLSMKVTNDSPAKALDRWLALLRAEALERLNGRS